jgi:hypothetical protein
MSLIRLPNGTFINPLSVQSVVATETPTPIVSVMLSTWHNFGNFFETITPAHGQTAEQLRDIIVADVNAGCTPEA